MQPMQHKRVIHEGVKYHCNQCDQCANLVVSLVQHKRIVHDRVKYSCKQCDRQADSRGSLDQHNRGYMKAESNTHAGSVIIKQLQRGILLNTKKLYKKE